MAYKRLGAKYIDGSGHATIGANYLLYTVPKGKEAIVDVHCLNRAAVTITIRIAFIDSDDIADIADEDYIVYEHPVLAKDFFDIVSIKMQELTSIMIRSSANFVGFIAEGFEQNVD